jgi:hypothetical protein
LIRNINYELLGKTELTTDILLKFEDNGINKQQYIAIKEQLNNYSANIDSTYDINFEAQYDEITQNLLIGLIISIPDIRYPKDVKLEQIINDHSYKFIQFYERTIQSFNSKNKRQEQ